MGGSSDAGSDYEHWADENHHFEAAATNAGGYDSHNGLHVQTYHPANIPKPAAAEVKKDKKCDCAPPPPQKAAPAPAPPQQAEYYQGYPQAMPHYYAPPHPYMVYPAPAYYGYPYQYQYPAPAPPAYAPQAQVYQPAPAKEEKKKLEAPAPRKWQGRTKAEVEEDNMKIAKNEGACDARKVEPKGLKEDQMLWCVEVDGQNCLRTYADIKSFKGEWKSDPRFEDSWFFVREAEK